MFLDKYVCPQPVFYLGSALTSFFAIVGVLIRMAELGLISAFDFILIIAVYMLIIYCISMLIDHLCKEKMPNAAMVVAALPLVSAFLSTYLYVPRGQITN